MPNCIGYELLMLLTVISYCSSTIFHDDTIVFWHLCWQAYYEPISVLKELVHGQRSYYERMFGVSTICVNTTKNEMSHEEDEEIWEKVAEDSRSFESSRHLQYDPFAFDFFIQVTIPFVVPIYNPKAANEHGRQSDINSIVENQFNSRNLKLDETLSNKLRDNDNPSKLSGTVDVISESDESELEKFVDNRLDWLEIHVKTEAKNSNRDVLSTQHSNTQDKTVDFTVGDGETELDTYFDFPLQTFGVLEDVVSTASVTQEAETSVQQNYEENPWDRSLIIRGDTRVTARTIFFQDTDVMFFLVLTFWTEDSMQDVFWRFLDASTQRGFFSFDILTYVDQMINFCFMIDVPFSTPIIT